MVKVNPKNGEEVKVIGTVVPSTPIYGVYYDYETSKLSQRPVVFFVVREIINRMIDYQSDIVLYPVTFNRDLSLMVEEGTETGNSDFLGLSEEPDLKSAVWAEETRNYKKRIKASR